MSVYKETKKSVLKIDEGSIFSSADFKDISQEKNPVHKALSNLCKQGTIERLSKSLYYKPERTELGTLAPSSSRVIEQLLKTYKKNIAYITGPSVYPRLGLTTQWSPEIYIATDMGKKEPMHIGSLKVTFCPSSFKGKQADTYLLQWLDAAKNIRSISGTTPTESALQLEQLLLEMSQKQRKVLVRYAQSYPASTRALVGLLLERIGEKNAAKIVYKSLSRTSIYRIPLQASVFPSLSQWNIR